MIKAFLSSTSKDLEPYRQRATKAINGIDGYHCIAMENFGARDSSAEVFCPDKVAECDLFVLFLGPTYGSCPPGSDKSYTHLEYETAVAFDKPRLIFASSKQFHVSQELISSVNPDQFQKQKNFRASINADRIWGEFATPDELDALISRAIQNWKNENGKDTLAKYLAHLIERNAYLNPRGVMQTQRQVSLKLDEVYISLRAERRYERRLTGRMRFIDREPRLPFADHGEDEIDEWMGPGGRATREIFSHESHTEQVELSAAVREHSRIVVLGDPGAGKTTLLRFLALQFAQSHRNGKPAVSGKDGAEYGETRLPIFLRVADYAEAFADDKTLRLAEFLATPFKDIAPEPAIASLFNDALKRGQAFVMLDGLDEVIDTSDRALIVRRIEDFVAGLDARNRVIVTSRIVGYREAPLGGDYQHFTLLDLERDQIEQFLRNWCHETERFLSKDASEEEIARNAQREIDNILQAVDNNPGVKRLAVNPLLLTILALIHRNGSRLPNRRVELYDLAAKTLLETWQIERMNAGKFNIREGEASQFLWPLAYWLHSEKPRGMATEQEIKYQLAKFLAATRKQEPDHPEIIAAADDFLRRVRHHTGLLVERAPNQYGFMHLSFEEYFAARELVRRPERVAKKIYALRHQPRWQEPILLAIGYLSEAFPSMPGDIIRSAILAEGADAAEEGFAPSQYEDVLHRDLLLAAQCIGDCVTIEQGLRRQVVERLVRLYLDSAGAGKYVTLRERIAEALNYLRNSEAANEAAEMALAALRDEKDDVRRSAAAALGELKVGAPEVVSGLLAALRDEKDFVRMSATRALGKIGGTEEVVGGLLAALRDEDDYVQSSAARALGEVSKDRKSKLPQDLSHQVADALRDMHDNPRNQDDEVFFSGAFVGGRAYKKSADVFWNALWLMCQRMDE